MIVAVIQGFVVGGGLIIAIGPQNAFVLNQGSCLWMGFLSYKIQFCIFMILERSKMAVKIDQSVPDVEGSVATGKSIKLSDLKGKNVVVYFYPKDNTPGCTTESCDFRDNHKLFTKQDTVILGVSRDSLRSHENFQKKYDLPFDLIADEDETICKQFDVIKMKNRYGKQVRGIERSTFLIDKKGILRKEWRNVKVDGHVDEILQAVKALP